MSNKSACSLLRRLGCMFYDGMLLFSLLFVGSFLVLPFTGGQAVSSDNILYPLLLLLACYGYFTWQWIHGGQTLGMRAWRCQLQQQDQVPVSLGKASARFFLALISWLMIGLGYLIGISRRDNLALHDLLSATVIVKINENVDK